MSQTCFSCPITSHSLLITQTDLLLVVAMSSSSSKPGAGPSRPWPALASRSAAPNGNSLSSGSSSSSAASDSRSGNSASSSSSAASRVPDHPVKGQDAPISVPACAAAFDHIGRQTLDRQHPNALARSAYWKQKVDRDDLSAMDSGDEDDSNASKPSVEGLRDADRMMRVVGARLHSNDCTLLRFRREIFALR